MKATQTENQIIIREAPGCLWFFGLFFVIPGAMLLWGTLGGFANWKDVSFWELAVSSFIAICVIVGGVWLISKSPVTRVVVDKANSLVSMTQWGLFGKRERKFAFKEIVRFCLVEAQDSDGDPIWFFGMKLASGETVKITTMSRPSEEAEKTFVFQTNEFIGKQLPPVEVALGSDDGSKN